MSKRYVGENFEQQLLKRGITADTQVREILTLVAGARVCEADRIQAGRPTGTAEINLELVDDIIDAVYPKQLETAAVQEGLRVVRELTPIPAYTKVHTVWESLGKPGDISWEELRST